MCYIENLVNARDALERGEIFEATRLLSEAATQVQELGPKYQRGIDAVAACHSRLERIIGSMDEVYNRMLNEVVPRWQQVADSENPSPDTKDIQFDNRALKELSRLAMTLSNIGIPEESEDGKILSVDQRVKLLVSRFPKEIKPVESHQKSQEDSDFQEEESE